MCATTCSPHAVHPFSHRGGALGERKPRQCVPIQVAPATLRLLDPTRVQAVASIHGWFSWREVPCRMQDAAPDAALVLHSSIAHQRYVRGCGGMK